DLEKRMREAAGNLEFEEAARLRDELKRLQETELMIGDDPMTRQSAIEDGAGRYGGGGSGKGRGGGKGGARSRAAKPGLDDMGPGTDRERPLGAEGYVRPAGRSSEGQPGKAPRYKGRRR
ncbi:MAG: UvrB/UvrC motif-containing protein, partial [Salinarimonas sp.]